MLDGQCLFDREDCVICYKYSSVVIVSFGIFVISQLISYLNVHVYEFMKLIYIFNVYYRHFIILSETLY